MKNLELWNKVEKTNPNYTKQANVKGNKITSIAPQFQIMNATEQFGVYGETWGFKNLDIDYTLSNVGLVTFKALFFFPKGEFEIINSISLWRDNAKTKIDADFAKKLETDTLTKALSKLGFNADIFLGKFDDERYLNEVNEEFKKPIEKGNLTQPIAIAEVKAGKTLEQIKTLYHVNKEQEKKLIKLLENGK
jgi:hypothetical protein